MTIARSSHAVLLIHTEARTPSSSASAKDVVMHVDHRLGRAFIPQAQHIKLGQHLVREETQHQEGMMANDATQIEQPAGRHNHSTIILLAHCRSGHDACNDHTVNNGKD